MVKLNKRKWNAMGIKSKKIKYALPLIIICATLGLYYHNSKPADAYVSNDGQVIYGYGTKSSQYGRPYERDYTYGNPGTISGSAIGPTTTGSPIQFLVAKASPTRVEKMIGHQKNDGRLDIVKCNSNCTASADFITQWNTTATTSGVIARVFDITYAQLSGRVMVVYAGNTTGKLYYCLYDGISWGPVSNCAPTNGVNDISLTDGTTSLTGSPRWVRLVSNGRQYTDNRSNDMLLAVEDSNSDIFVTRWDGSSWTTSDRQVVTTTGGASNLAAAFDVAWENGSGTEMIVYANGTTTAYRTSTGSGWSAPTTIQTYSSAARWFDLASDPQSDRLSMLASFGSTTVRPYIWKTDGSTPGWTAGSDLAGYTDTGNNMSTAWEKANSGVSSALFVATPSSSPVDSSYHTWTESSGFTSWTTLTSSSSYNLNTHKLFASPNSDDIMDAYDNLRCFLYLREYDGSAWKSELYTNVNRMTNTTTGCNTRNNTPYGQNPYMFTFKPYSAWSLNWRWYNDETTAGDPGSPLAAEGVMPTVAPGNAVRLRLNIVNQGRGVENDTRKKLQYSSGAGCPDSSSCVWTDVGEQGSGDIWRYADGGYADDTVVNSTLLTGSTGNGTAIENGTAAAPNSDQGATSTLEYDYTIENHNASLNTTYYFRAYDYGASESGGPLTNLNAIPRLQTRDISGNEQNSCVANGTAAACTYPSIFSNQSAPSAPSIYAPTNNAINIPVTPEFDLRAADDEGDYLQYVIEICGTNSWPCPSGGSTFCQSVLYCTGGSQTDWSGQDAFNSNAYQAFPDLNTSTMAIYTVSNLGIFAPSTDYYARAKAIDPGGKNEFGPYSATLKFTTSSSPVIQIRGGSTINGGTQIGGSL